MGTGAQNITKGADSRAVMVSILELLISFRLKIDQLILKPPASANHALKFITIKAPNSQCQPHLNLAIQILTMAFKLVAFAALVAVAQAGHLGLYGGVAYNGLAAPALATSYAHGIAAAPVVSAYAAPAVSAYAAPAVAAYAAPAVAKTVVAAPAAPAAYDFGYSVSDPLTGDHKSQVETRRGDAVQGSYSLVDSDGTKRTVDYAADGINGFNAVVRKEPLAVAVKTVAPAVAAYAAPAVVAAPAVAKVATTYAAAPAYAHGIAPVVAHGYAAAPAVAHGYAAHGYAAAPVVAHGYAAAPALAHAW